MVCALVSGGSMFSLSFFVPDESNSIFSAPFGSEKCEKISFF